MITSKLWGRERDGRSHSDVRTRETWTASTDTRIADDMRMGDFLHAVSPSDFFPKGSRRRPALRLRRSSEKRSLADLLHLLRENFINE